MQLYVHLRDTLVKIRFSIHFEVDIGIAYRYTYSMKLKDYIKTNKINIRLFTKRIGLRSRMSIYRYFNGTIPNPATMERIVTVTNGEVTPNDFY